MKKSIILAFAAAVALASCGNKAAQPEATDSVETTAEATNAEDVTGAATKALASNLAQGDVEKVKETLTTIQLKYQELVESGKLEEAKKYAIEVQKYITDNAEQIKSMTGDNQAIVTLIDGIKSLPTDASATAEQALSAVQKSADDLVKKEVEKVNQVANEKVEEAKSKVNEAVNAEVEKAKQKAGDAAKQAVSDAASKLLGK